MTHKQKVPRTSQNQPDPTKKPRTNVPPPQVARVIKRFISGQSLRKIAREEKRDRETVRRLVQADEVREYVLKLREEFYGLGSDAVDAVLHQLQVEKNGRLGLEILKGIGVVPQKRVRHRLLHLGNYNEQNELDDLRKLLEERFNKPKEGRSSQGG
jgi:hypothetical protein